VEVVGEQVEVAVLACTRQRLSGHETYMMSTRGAHYVGPVRFGARGRGGGGGVGGGLKRVATMVLAASVRTRRRCGAHEIHIMST
jgi:hypothetical protein